MNSLQPYLVRSGVVHLLGLALFITLSLLNRESAKKNYYTIDFLGGAPAGSMEAAAPVKAAAAAPTAAPKVNKPEPLPSLKRWLQKAKAATLRESELAVKPKPGEKAVEAVQEPAAMAPTRQDPNTQPAAGSGGGGGADVMADPVAFPFPWYLARLRSALWATWSQRMPGGGKMCVVTFVIARNGSVSEVGVSEGSLESDFDYAAMASVQEAAPFPPLPEDFPDQSLKVHVKFQSL